MTTLDIVSILCYTVSIAIAFSLFKHAHEHGKTLTFFILAYFALTAGNIYSLAVDKPEDMTIEIFTCISSLFFLGASVMGRRIILALEKSMADIKRAEERYRILFEMLPVGVVVSHEGKILHLNNTGLKLAGAGSFEELKDRELLDFVAPEYRKMAADRLKETLNNIGNPRILPAVRERLIKVDGAPLAAEIISASVMGDNKPMTISVFSDISEKEAAERELNLLAASVAHAAEAVALTDASANIQYVNPAFEKMTGYSRAEVAGKNMRIFRSGSHSRSFYDAMWKTVLSGKVWNNVIINRRKDGTLYEERSTIAPVSDSAGGITGFINVKSDNSGEAALRRAKTFFTMITSHELRTPLTKLQYIRMLIDEIRNAGTDGDRVQKLKSLADTAYEEFDRIITATTLLSEISSTADKSAFTPAYLFMAVQKSFNSAKLKASMEGRKIDFSIDTASLPMDVEILGVFSYLERGFEELISNSVKYSPEGKTVSVTARLDGASAVVEIRDEGIGIEPEMIEKVTEPFFSPEKPELHSSGQYKFKGGGIGLGLTLVKCIVEFHGGAFKIYSAGRDRGVTATVILPLMDKAPQ